MVDNNLPPLNEDGEPGCDGATEDTAAVARRQAWLECNREAIKSWNEFTDRAGLPLDRFRQF